MTAIKSEGIFEQNKPPLEISETEPRNFEESNKKGRSKKGAGDFRENVAGLVKDVNIESTDWRCACMEKRWKFRKEGYNKVS